MECPKDSRKEVSKGQLHGSLENRTEFPLRQGVGEKSAERKATEFLLGLNI